MNKVLIIGSGAREHAFGLSMPSKTLLFAPGNPGTAQIGTNFPIQSDDINKLCALAIEQDVDLVIVGPEKPLSLGLADLLRKHQIPVFGPNQYAAQLESSKVFAKAFMENYNIPTAASYVYSLDAADKAKEFVLKQNKPFVVKADGLAAGKGVIVPSSIEETLTAIDQIIALKVSNFFLLEEILHGKEISLHVLTDGVNYRVLPIAKDYKRAYNNDLGPNTGGMGAYAPVPIKSDEELEIYEDIIEYIVKPTLFGLQSSKMPFLGVLFIGLMLTQNGPKVLEYNVRFGDPEATVILPLYTGDWYSVFKAVADGDITTAKMASFSGHSVSVVMAAQNYPNTPKINDPIKGDTSKILHAGTRLENNCLRTNGGRVLCVNHTAETLESARIKAYEVINQISWDGEHHRTDIAI